jgi:RNA polymerase sigma-70 factor, ECF subfamily
MSGKGAALSADLESVESFRPLLFSIAYRMLGSVMEAEDMVQETFLKYVTVPEREVREPKALLTTIVTHLCIDQLKSARVQRENYIGTWLPEPLLTGDVETDNTALSDNISMAFMVLLESLSPIERAVFLLREVFDYEYDEIAEMVGKSATNCRQYYSRAKKYIAEHRTRFKPSPAHQLELTNAFIQAVTAGDVDTVQQMLTDDVTVYADGGGKVAAAKKPVTGREIVTQILLRSLQLIPENSEIQATEINGAGAWIVWTGDAAFAVVTIGFDGDKIKEFRIIANPDKLQHLTKQ